jgi:uncharacterized protein
MFSLQEFFGRDTKLFALLDASAEEGVHITQSLTHLLKHPKEVQNLDEFLLARRKEKRITEQIREQLCKTMVTPLDSEDIEALANSLYKMPKAVEKFAERLLLSPEDWRQPYFSKQVHYLEQAAATVHEMVRILPKHPSLDKIKDHNDKLQYLEGEADKLILETLKDLYSGKHEALKVLMIRELSEVLEKAIDRCRDTGNIIFRIVLKNC